MSFALHEASCFELSVQIQNVFTTLMTVHVRWPGETGGAFGFALTFLVLFVPIHREQKEHTNYLKGFYVLSFACAKERTKPACRQAGKSTPATIYSRCRMP